jgi:heme a synthase
MAGMPQLPSIASVTGALAAPPADRGATGPVPSRRDRLVAAWLLGCAVLVVALVLLGGVTRLTGSGLSIVEWRPISGVLPPLDAAAWEAELALYRQSPEFRLRNPDLDLAGFQRIYWVEWAHRLLGRLAGVAFALPLAWLAWRGWLSRRLLVRLVAILALGGAQGAVGWLMVASGLVDRPQVSPYRLTAHLMLALALLAALLWTALGLLRRPADAPRRRLAALARVATAAVVLTLVWGGFMAGTRAGYAYATFPLIHGQLLPPGAWQLVPWWTNPFENLLTVQLLHRGLALLSLGLVAAWWWAARDEAAAERSRLHVVLALAVLQVALGAATVLLGVPLAIALAHQAGGVALLVGCLVAGHGVLLRSPVAA